MKKLLFLAFLLIGGMAYGQTTKVNVGTAPNSGNGDPLRTAFATINAAIDVIDTKLAKSDSTTGAGKYATDHRADLIEAQIADTATFEVEDIRNVVIISVGDTTVTALTGRIVFKTSDKHFYGCVQTNTSYRKWKQLDN